MSKEIQDTQTKQDPKLQQFTQELESLLTKYQYQLKAQVAVTSNGITPSIVIVNVIPEKTVKKKGKK